MSKRREPDTPKEAEEPSAKRHKAASIDSSELVVAKGASVLEAEFRAANEAALKAAAEIMLLYKERDVRALEVPKVKGLKRDGGPLLVRVDTGTVALPRRKKIMAGFSFPIPSHLMHSDRADIGDDEADCYQSLVLYDDMSDWWPRCQTDAERADMAKYAETMANDLAHVLVTHAKHMDVVDKIRADAGSHNTATGNIFYGAMLHTRFNGKIEIGPSIEEQEAVLPLIYMLKSIGVRHL